jgi:hypothetical protein
VVIRVSGVEAERIDQGYSRVHEYYSRLLSPQKREDLEQLGWGRASGSYADGSQVAAVVAGAGGSKTILFQPSACGLVSGNGKWLPMWICGSAGITIELELDSADASFLTVANSSTNYALTQCKLLVDTYQVDSSLMEAYTRHVLSGKPLLVPYSTKVCTSISTTTDRAEISVARAFSRVKSVIATLHGPTGSATRNQVLKGANDFYVPRATKEEMSFRLSIGAKNWGDNSYQGITELWLRLLKGVGCLSSAAHSTSIDRPSFENSNAAGNGEAAQPAFSAYFDVEKVPGAADHSGYSTANGSPIVIQMRNVGASSADYASRMTIVCEVDCFLELMDSSANVLQ